MKALRMKLLGTSRPYPGLEHVSYFLGSSLISVWHPWCLWILALLWYFGEPYLQADLWNDAEGSERSHTDERNWILFPESRARILMETSSSPRLSLWQTSFPSVQENQLSINSFKSFYPALASKSWPRAQLLVSFWCLLLLLLDRFCFADLYDLLSHDLEVNFYISLFL